MADGVTFEIKGLDEILVKLDSLKYDTRRKGGRAALRKAAQFIRDAARTNARKIDDPKTREVIAENIVDRWNSRLHKRTGDLGFRVGVLGGARAPAGSKQERASARRRERGGYASLDQLGEIAGSGSGNPGGDTFYWRFVEFGTKDVAARPFLRPALANNINAATDVFVKEFDKAIDRAIKRAAKRGEAA